MNFLFSDEFLRTKVGVCLAILVCFGYYADQNRILFSPTLEDCLSGSSMVKENAEIVFGGSLSQKREGVYLGTGTRNLKVDITVLKSVPFEQKISFVGECKRDSILKIVRWETRGNVKYMKYIVSLLGLSLTLLVFSKNFKFEKFSFRLR